MVCLTCISGIVIAQPSLGGRAGAPMRFGFGAAALGMWNSVASLAGRDAVALYNPALAPFQTTPAILAGSALMSLDRSLLFVSYGTHLPPSAGISFTIVRAGVSSIVGRDRNGVPTQSYSVAENAFGLSFGLRPAPDLSIGVTARLLYAQMIEELTSTTVGLDLGASYLVQEGLRGSIVLRDVNAKYKWDTKSLYGQNANSTIDKFPTRFIVALGWTPAETQSAISIEAEAVAGGWLYRTGAEISLHEMLVVRAGVDGIDPTETLGSRWSAGLSVVHTGLPWNPTFDYAFMSEPYSPSPVHVITLRLYVKE